jgi:hypothetical protein
MKKLTLILVFVLATSSLFATKRTVSNVFTSPAQYNNLQTAIDASAYGDTVYVQPSTISYGSLTIVKKIIIIGAGYDGRSYQRNEITYIAGINLSYNGLLSSSSYSSFIGLYFSSISPAFDTCHHITIARCRVDNINNFGGGSANQSSWTIYNNIITTAVNFNRDYGNVVSNNHFTGGYNCITSASNVGGTNLVNNNNFTGAFYINSLAILATSYVQYYNNIFNNLNFAGQNVVILATNNIYINNTFTKNLTYFISNTLPPLYNNNNNGTGNINNQNPLFTNAPTYGIPFSADSIVSYNFRLLPASPGKNTGTDGTDMGVYGGTAYPFKNDQGISALPQVIQLNILNPAVPLNTNLNVNSKGVKRN